MTDWFPKRTFGVLPDDAARRWGARDALVFRDRRWTFQQFSEEVDRVAKGLLALGVAPGDKVGLWMLNSPEWIFSMFAAAKVGGVLVPINSRLRSADVGYIVKQSDCSTLISIDRSGPIDYLGMIREMVSPDGPVDGEDISTAGLPALKRILLSGAAEHEGTTNWPALLAAGERVSDAALAERAAAVDPDDVVFIMYTSGTTGFPKGAMHGHIYIRLVTDQCNRMAVVPQDVILTNSPLFHGLALCYGPLTSLSAGARQVLTEAFDPDESLDLVEREGVTLMHGFDFTFKALLNAQARRPRNVSTLRTGIVGTGMASATPVAYRVAETFLQPTSAYGSTELGIGCVQAFLTATPLQQCESSGYPLPDIEVRIVGLPANTPGEIQVRGYILTRGYYKRPEATAEAIDADGWFHSGDMGEIWDDGYMRLIGRYKDILKVGGENVDPIEVEKFLLEYPGVQQVAVVGYPDRKLTEVGVAFVIPNPGVRLDLDALLTHCKGKIASYKIPRRFLVVDAFPLTGSGKVQKFKLRDQAREQLGGFAPGEPPSIGV